MALPIETFRHEGDRSFGITLFKALGHPIAAEKAIDLVNNLKKKEQLIIIDPENSLEIFDSFYNISSCNITNVFVQNVLDKDKTILGKITQPISELIIPEDGCIFIASFDSTKLLDQIKSHTKSKFSSFSFDNIRIEESWLSNKRSYLDPLNFATNFALFREDENTHTIIKSANYWGGYNSPDAKLWLSLFDQSGTVLAQWEECLPPPNGGFEIDSRIVQEQFNLNNFIGSLFIHAIRINGHDIVKYALDIIGQNNSKLSTTHDANAWPADYYAGLPAPDDNEQVTLWIQNSHPMEIPAGSVSFNVMGSNITSKLDESIPPFATKALDISSLLPGIKWPKQIEIQAGRHFVRPRYEISKNDRNRIAHVNVERTDLVHDTKIKSLGELFGKGFILPMPILPTNQYNTTILPTPMSRNQNNISLGMITLNPEGKKLSHEPLGCFRRDHALAVDVNKLINNKLNSFGHLELLYDFTEDGDVDGWIHAIARYEDIVTGHISETSFGSHIYNTLNTYKNEPQSYAGAPPGLSTRLFLRIGPESTSTFCHLIYPVSKTWHPRSETTLSLISNNGKTVAEENINIPCGGSVFWTVDEIFTSTTLKQAGTNGYILVRDKTCRIFGYHGLKTNQAFSIDHMFGF